MKISVIMGVFNAQETLRDAIDSILCQTEHDIELILCDDGSTDSSFDIINKYAKKDRRVVVLQNEQNRGLAFTLNRCLDVSKGMHIARMDADDTCSKERLEIQSKFLDANPQFAFVSCRMKRVNEFGEYQIRNNYIPNPLKSDLIHGSPFAHAPLLIRRSSILFAGKYDDSEGTLGVEDYDLWFRLYDKGFLGHNIDAELYTMFDGVGAQNRRNWRRRVNEAFVRYRGYRKMNVSFMSYIFVLKPIILGFIPSNLYSILRGYRPGRV
jgi:glycosyltransferase EpsE